MDSLYGRILAVFVPLSLLSVGGGLAVLPAMHRDAVLNQHWISEATFVADYAISRMAPGPGSLIATLIGYQAGGVTGAFLATIGMFLPSSILMYALVRVWARHRGARWQIAIERGLAPVAAGLILSSCLTLLRAAQGGWMVPVVSLASMALVLSGLANALLLVGGGALLFLLIRS